MTDPSILDRILELQFIVGWAGEGETDPPRQGWWRTNWTDEYGGLDLLQRLVPRTALWAQFELVRAAARKVDADGLHKQADVARIRTLFHLNPDLDRELEERLQEHKQSEASPFDALPGLRMTEDWDADAFAAFIGDLAEGRNFVAEPFGKRLTGQAPEEPAALVRTLAQGLLPLNKDYPRPYAVTE